MRLAEKQFFVLSSGVSTDYLLGSAENHSINVDGLTDRQIEAITLIVNELRENNTNS